jgi:hypothetical protein
MKRNVYASGLAAVLGVLAALWFFDTYEQVDSRVRVGASSAARANPYLAAMRFMERMEFSASTIARPGDLDQIPAGATLILLSRRAMVTPERAQALALWASAGGHLIVEPEPLRYRDVMLDTLGIGRGQAPRTKLPQTMTVVLPNAEHPLQVTSSFRETLQLAHVKPDLVVADAGGARLASLRHGAGRISIVTGFRRFTNRAIGAHDNAELLWQVLRLAPSNQKVLVLRAPLSAPILQWLQDHAIETIIAGLALLVLWLWRTAVRFGPIQPRNEPDRRQLLEHIRACGRFRWSNGARVSLLGAAREICQSRVAKLQPRLVLLSKEQRYRELSAQLGIGTNEIAYAFEGLPNVARDFVHSVATLASIHASLSRTPGVPRLRRKRL